MQEPLIKKHERYIECYACSHRCRIRDGQVGICGVRANEGGDFRLIVYGRPCAVWADPIEKKPLFHFLPGTKSYSIGTFGCNLKCAFCQNWDISQAPHDAKEKDPKRWRDYFSQLVDRCGHLSPDEAVSNALAQGCRSISFTYNEPTIFTEYALDTMELALKRGLKGVYVTNGFQTRECWERLEGYIHATNIDLKAYSDEFYRTICGARLEPVKESIRSAKELGIWTEVTTLVIPGENDSDEELKAIAQFLHGIDPGMPWHVTAFTPMYRMLDKPRTPPESLVRAREIGKSVGLKHVYAGNLPFSYSNMESTLCPKCGKAVVERVGFSVMQDSIKGGRCSSCGEPIAGVWE